MEQRAGHHRPAPPTCPQLVLRVGAALVLYAHSRPGACVWYVIGDVCVFACAQVINGAREMGIRVRASLIVTCTDQTADPLVDAARADEERRQRCGVCASV